MKLSVSNLAWLPDEEADALPMLAAEGVDGLEVAPSLAFGGFDVGRHQVEEYRRRVADHGLQVRALQSILFDHPELRVFDPASHDAMLEHISTVASMGSALGAQVLVFGAPANRRRGGLAPGESTEMAAGLFRLIGDRCDTEGVSLAIEHNPAEYGTDFLNSLTDVAAFVEVVDHPRIGLNVDTGGLALSGGDYRARLVEAPPFLHLHLSEPNLAPVGQGSVDFAGLIAVLTHRSYDGWVSIEMKRPPEGLSAVRASVRMIKALLSEGGAGP